MNRKFFFFDIDGTLAVGTPIIDTNLKSAFWTLILFMPIFLLTREQEKHKTKEE